SILNEEIDRVGQIVNGLTQLEPTMGEGQADLGRVVREVVRLFKDTGFVPPSVNIIVRMQDQHCAIEGSVDMVKQILMNLMKNAVEAMPAGGEIEIVNNG